MYLAKIKITFFHLPKNYITQSLLISLMQTSELPN